jgi:hypothetical protein
MPAGWDIALFPGELSIGAMMVGTQE